jgi:Spy/CpxP family protein refolding chaperone
MKRKMWIATAAAAALMLAASIAFGQPKAEKKAMRHGFHAIPGLTEEQETKVKALDLDLEKALLPMKAQMGVKVAELKGLALADNPDKAAIDKKIDDIGALRTQIMKKKIQNKLAVRALLTPDQRVDFDKKAMRMGRGFMGWNEEGPGGMERMKIIKRFRSGREEGMMFHPGRLEETEEKETEK